jgi:hypothetical protein
MSLEVTPVRMLDEIEKPPRICEPGGSGIFIRSSYWKDFFSNEENVDNRPASDNWIPFVWNR